MTNSFKLVDIVEYHVIIPFIIIIIIIIIFLYKIEILL